MSSIIFDPQIFCLQAYGGISRYFVELASQLSIAGDISAEIYAPLHINQLYSGGKRVRTTMPGSKKLITISNLMGLYRYLNASGGCATDILHHTYYWPVPLGSWRGKRVTTIHDMIDERVSPNPLKSLLKRRSALAADHIICVSENTRNDLIAYFGIDASKISVVHLGCNPPSSASLSRCYAAPYVLFVGERRKYKNFLGLLSAFGLSKALRDDFHIVCFGGGEFSDSELAAIEQAGLNRKACTQISGGDEVLSALYFYAEAMVYPSFYEGFGLPPLEAMAHGAPVAASRVASIPEVLGGACQYFDPEHPESIVDALEQIVYKPARRDELIRLGQLRSAEFTWRKCADATRSVYNLLH